MIHRSASARAGFTLIEVLLVIGILVTLGTVGVVAYTKIKKSSDIQMAQTQVRDTCNAIDLFHNYMQRFPDGEKGLQELITPPDDEKEKAKWNNGGPFLKDGKIPEDPWGIPLSYEKIEKQGDEAGPDYRVTSAGPNKTLGDEDDIKSSEDKK